MITTEPAPPERTALYRLYDSAGLLLYAGVSNAPPYRMAQHGKDKPWWPNVADQKLEWFDTRDEALDAERLAIFTERPKYNHVHNPSPVLHELRPMNLHELAGSPWRPFEFIAADLRAFVQSGSLAPGDKFPTTAELMAAYGVSSLTAQHALKLLKSEGFAVGRMGSAVRATLPQGFRNEHASVTNDVEGVVELLPRQEGHPTPKLCKALGVDRGTATSAQRWVRHVDGVPVELVHHFAHPASIPVDQIHHVSDLVTADVPTPEQVAALRLPKEAPTLSIVRTLFTDDHRVMAAQKIVKSGHLLSISYAYNP